MAAALVRYSPQFAKLEKRRQDLANRNRALRERYQDLKDAAESKGRHLFRATLAQAGAFAAGAVSLEDEDTERTIAGAPAPAVLGAGLIALGLFAPGDSYAADALVSAGAGALAGWSFTKGQELSLAWGREEDETTPPAE